MVLFLLKCICSIYSSDAIPCAASAVKFYTSARLHIPHFYTTLHSWFIAFIVSIRCEIFSKFRPIHKCIDEYENRALQLRNGPKKKRKKLNYKDKFYDEFDIAHHDITLEMKRNHRLAVSKQYLLVWNFDLFANQKTNVYVPHTNKWTVKIRFYEILTETRQFLHEQKMEEELEIITTHLHGGTIYFSCVIWSII